MKYKIIVDKQPKTNPSNEKKEYEIDIEELRCKGNVADSLIITKEGDYVMRKLKLSEFHVLTVLEEPIKEPLNDINIELFEGDNYIYLLDMVGNKFYAEYLVKSDFNDIYVTKNEMNSAINQTAGQIELTVNQKLTEYATGEDLQGAVTELNSSIIQKANEITSTVSSKYETKTGVDTKISTAKSQIKQTTDSISIEVSKKVGNNEIVSKINQSAEAVKINANKIELSAIDVLNLLAGNTINLTGQNISISSTNFNVDKNGKAEFKDFTVKSGRSVLTTEHSIADFVISLDNDSSKTLYLMHNILGINNGNEHIEIDCQDGPKIDVYQSGGIGTYIKHTGITTPKLTQTSLKSKKKNIKKLKINALELVKEADICEYNFKGEKKGDKKHIGLVIGEGYNCPEQVISQDGQGVEQYSLTSLLYKAVQELTAKVEKLEQEVANDRHN